MSDGKKAKRGLGMGLSALLGGDDPDLATVATPASQMVPIEYLRPSPLQPRRVFDEAELEALEQSIRANGVLQPLLVRPTHGATASYDIVAGERRWRAAQRAGLHELPVVVRDLDDRTALELALVENIQRADLAPLEEAEAYRRLIDEFGHSQEELGQALGRSRSHVANTLRLLGLPEPVRTLLQSGQLTAGHARALLGAPDPAALASVVVQNDLSVRETEALVRSAATKPKQPAKQSARSDADTVDLERRLAERLGLKVAIKSGSRGGVVTIRWRDLEQLQGLVSRFL